MALAAESGTDVVVSLGGGGLVRATDAIGRLQTLAATTNASFFNQLFFVTTGTGGANKVDFVQNKPLRQYVEENLDSVARDMAAGQGESLAAVAELAGIPVEQRAAFYAACQSRFSEVFASENVTSDEVVASLAKLAS